MAKKTKTKKTRKAAKKTTVKAHTRVINGKKVRIAAFARA